MNNDNTITLKEGDIIYKLNCYDNDPNSKYVISRTTKTQAICKCKYGEIRFGKQQTGGCFRAKGYDIFSAYYHLETPELKKRFDFLFAVRCAEKIKFNTLNIKQLKQIIKIAKGE